MMNYEKPAMCVREITERETSLWDAFIQDSPQGSLFASSIWKNVIERATSSKQRIFAVDNMLFAKDGEDYTCEIIGDTSYVFLVVQYDVEHTNTKPQQTLNELFTWANKQGFTFYAATSSLNEKVEAYKEKYNVQYTFLDADDIPLKTIVRANPGLVLLKDGVVINNWHGNDIPSIEEFSKLLIK